MSFKDWLVEEMRRKDISQADLARLAHLTTGAISNYVGGRIPDKDALKKIAKGLKVSPVEAFKAAGILPPDQEQDELTQRAVHILNSLHPESKRQALAFLEFLFALENRGGRHAKTNIAPIEPS